MVDPNRRGRARSRDTLASLFHVHRVCGLADIFLGVAVGRHELRGSPAHASGPWKAAGARATPGRHLGLLVRFADTARCRGACAVVSRRVGGEFARPWCLV